jgi:hypothetical protein
MQKRHACKNRLRRYQAVIRGSQSYARPSENGEAIYRIYYGHPTDKSFSSVDGYSIVSHETTMDSLEAGTEAYENRRQGYEARRNFFSRSTRNIATIC